VLPFGAQQARHQVRGGDRPAGLDGLGREERPGRRGDLAPAHGAAGVLDPDEQVLQIRLAVRAGLELVDQGQPHLQQLDAIDPHGHSASA
jgi:hypothetical protein